MGSNGTPIEGQATTGSTPEDVANLYAWANLHGAKYRDYSASRREHRAQVRYGAAKALLERELKAQAEAEASAEAAEREARDAEARALSAGTSQPQHTRFAALRTAEAAALRAAADRVEAARRAEAAAHANVIALREQRELAEATASAAEQAMIYTEVETLRRQLAGPQPHFGLDQTAVAAAGSEPEPAPVDTSLAETTPALPVPIWQPLSETILGADNEWTSPPRPASASVNMGEKEDLRPAWFVGSAQDQAAREADAGLSAQTPVAEPTVSDPEPPTPDPEASSADLEPSISQQDLTNPAVREPALPPVYPLVGRDSVQQDSRDQSLNPAAAVLRPIPYLRTPLLAVFSLAGGAGVTSAVAGIGRALSAAGEKVLLVDATSRALLPFYFGGRELRDGLMRTWSPPQGTGEDVSLILHNATHLNGDAAAEERLTEQIWASAFGTQRILVDLSASAVWLFRRWANLAPAVLVPLIPDMDSLIHVEATETLFRNIVPGNEQPLQPFYFLNQFDASRALHQELRSILERRLGDRLLRFAIRNSMAISEALADGNTALDYAPQSGVAWDYHEIASWVRHLSPPRAAHPSHLRWGEF